MDTQKILLSAILIVGIIGLGALMYGVFFSGPDLVAGNKTILVLAADKDEQPGGGVDMAFMVTLKNGKLKNYTAIYPGGMRHPTMAEPAPGVGGKMLLHDSLWNTSGPTNLQYAKEIVEYNTGEKFDAVVLIYNTGLDAVIDSIRPFEVNGVVSNLSATDIVRENDAYSGYGGPSPYGGTMSRGDAAMVLVKALVKAFKNPEKKNKMIQAALDQYSKGNIMMEPQGSFNSLLATKGLDVLL
ncbi:MAG: DUF4012 domain-containing protein [Methanobrevibacter sp.]|nr:DUF4012 domain-containing protein [Methanobrevibacter sp.]